jgi:hypothetical protein
MLEGELREEAKALVNMVAVLLQLLVIPLYRQQFTTLVKN